MSETVLFNRLAELAIATTTVEHPAVFTTEEARVHTGHLPGGHVKNLFLKDKKDRLWLVVCLEDRALDLKALAKTLGAASCLSFGRAELLAEVLGVTPGSVTPLALINDPAGRVEVVLDAAMLEHRVLNVHPLRNTATTAITSHDLLRFVASTGRKPRILDLDALAAPGVAS
ncbi:prolyl-tRNA synthetase associated domain-containing protein [Marinivivus vitaminiproducens]|uniref:prolyl-tRNA synthetase associated domain-containing protein n=1 Tax=Marinivivus vitaminiproducens TaxID=3035935 RepID=UPI00279AAEB5|nr:prolyl-tRNA synthetase associated domain-containing protein [Geminicoccaceae bacterium SCSIO 64248]